MTEERFLEIIKDSEDKHAPSWEGDNAWQGLLIIAKYFNPAEKSIITGAEHDIIYSVGTDEIVEAGITEEEAIALRKLNWMEGNGCLACFV